VIRGYGHTLSKRGSHHSGALPRLLSIAEELERAIGPITIVFAHNDLLAANFIDSGDRLWLIDWDYAGFNSPLFDLANLASNNGIEGEDETWLVQTYFEGPCDAGLMRRYTAMRCASLLREAMWSMVSELTSALDFDYAAYTAENLGRFERAWAAFEAA